MSTRQNPDLAYNENIAETIARESRRPQALVQSGEEGDALFALPDGWRLETSAMLERLAPTPYRKRGQAKFVDTASFISFANLHKLPETALYAQVDRDQKNPLTITAVFNDHQPSAFDESSPGWQDFSATLVPKVSHEWSVWLSNSGKPMSQFEFALFIEDNMKDIASPEDKTMPTGTQMLQLATRFELTQDKRIKSAVRVQSGGTNIEYVEDEDAGTVERMQAFDRFALGIPVFWRGQAYMIEAKLRYRLREGVLKIWYDLVRPDAVVDDAVESVLAQVQTGVGINVFYGAIAK